jgi:cell division protein FtsB
MNQHLRRRTCRGFVSAWIAALLFACLFTGCGGGGSQAGKETDPQKIEQNRQEAEKMSQREFQNK